MGVNMKPLSCDPARNKGMSDMDMSMSRSDTTAASGTILFLSSQDLQTVMQLTIMLMRSPKRFGCWRRAVVNHRCPCKSV